MANEITDAFNEAFRDHDTTGMPASGAHKPRKSEIRGIGPLIDERISEMEAMTIAGIKWLPVSSGTIRVRATGNVDIATGLVNATPMNGVTLATGDHVFLGFQTNAAQNGVYTVVAAGAASRAAFLDSAAELAYVGFVIQLGTVGAGEQWTLPLAAASITVGTTPLPFAPVGAQPSYASEVQEARGGAPTLRIRLDSDRNAVNEFMAATGYFSPLLYFAATGHKGGFYDLDDPGTLWQDRAQTTRCTAAGQLVGAINDTSGNGNHLIAFSDAARGTLELVNGRRIVRIVTGNRYLTNAADKTIKVPSYLAVAMQRATGGGLTQFFGISGDNNNRFQILNHSANENRMDSILRNVAHGQVVISTQFEEAPYNAPLVADALAVAGTLDISVNGGIPETAANAWTVDSVSAAARYQLTPVSNVPLDFYGGVILEADPGIYRSKFVEFLRRKCERPAASTDLVILIISDSTGDSEGEWAFRFAQYLATANPTKFVGYRLFSMYSVPKKKYWPEIAVAAPAGETGAIRIYNAAIAGSVPQEFTGDNFDPAIRNIPKPGVIFWNHGLNLTGVTNEGAAYIAPMDQVRLQWPGVPHMAIRQNPYKSTDSMVATIARFDSVVARYGDIPVADVYNRYISNGKPPAWYADEVHPSIPTGVNEWMPLIQAMWEANWPMPAGAPAFLASKKQNLLLNGKFEDWSGALPANWTLTGAGSVKKDASLRDGDAVYSLRMIDAMTNSYIQQVIDATPHRGAAVSLAVRQYLVAAGLDFMGRIQVVINGTGGATTNYSQQFDGIAGWLWMALSNLAVPADATTITVRLYCKVDTPGSGQVNFGRAVLTKSPVPQDMLCCE